MIQLPQLSDGQTHARKLTLEIYPLARIGRRARADCSDGFTKETQRHGGYCQVNPRKFFRKLLKGLRYVPRVMTSDVAWEKWSGRRESNPYYQLGKLATVRFIYNNLQNC